MCVFCAVAAYIWRNHSGWPRDHLAMYAYVQGNYENGAAYTFILLITFWILFSYLVPISLFVTMEIVKFWQVKPSLPHVCLCSISAQTQAEPALKVFCSISASYVSVTCPIGGICTHANRG